MRTWGVLLHTAKGVYKVGSVTPPRSSRHHPRLHHSFFARGHAYSANVQSTLSTSTPAELGVEYDDVVVGAGIMGSATAYQLAKRGRRVLLLEQFDFLHRRGSSHGESRIIRPTYPQQYYTKMMKQAYVLWEEAQQQAGTSVYTQTGGLDFAVNDNPDLLNLLDACKKEGVEHAVLTPAQLRERFPLVHLPEDYTAVLNPEAGMLNATKQLARDHGAVTRDQTPVLDIVPSANDDNVSVVTTAGTVHCNKCVVTVGAWASKMLYKVGGDLDVPLTPIHTTVGYFEVEDRQHWSANNFPVFIMYANSLAVYGCPSREYPGLIKVALHAGPECDPDMRSLSPGYAELDGSITPFIKEHFRGVNPKAAIAEACMYTMTPDHDFIIDFLPGSKSVIIGAPCSGHGFKLGSLVGKMLADMALTGTCEDVDINTFKLDRSYEAHVLY